VVAAWGLSAVALPSALQAGSKRKPRALCGSSAELQCFHRWLPSSDNVRGWWRGLSGDIQEHYNKMPFRDT